MDARHDQCQLHYLKGVSPGLRSCEEKHSAESIRRMEDEMLQKFHAQRSKRYVHATDNEVNMKAAFHNYTFMSQHQPGARTRS